MRKFPSFFWIGFAFTSCVSVCAANSEFEVVEGDDLRVCRTRLLDLVTESEAIAPLPTRYFPWWGPAKKSERGTTENVAPAVSANEAEAATTELPQMQAFGHAAVPKQAALGTVRQHQQTAKMVAGRKAFKEYLTMGFPDAVQDVGLPFSVKGSAAHAAKTFLNLVIGDNGGVLPRPLSDMLGKHAAGIRRAIHEDRVAIRILAEMGGEKYVPTPEKHILQVVRETRDLTRQRLGVAQLAEPILNFLGETQDKFLQLLTLLNHVSEDQAELQALFMQATKYGLVDINGTQGRQVYDSLLIATLSEFTEVLSDETLTNLRFLFRLDTESWAEYAHTTWLARPFRNNGRTWVPLNATEDAVTLQNHVRQVLARAVENQREFVRAAVEFGSHYSSYVKLAALLDGALRPDGDPSTESYSILANTMDEELTDFPTLRDWYNALCKQNGATKIFDHTAKRHVEYNLDHLFRSEGTRCADPILRALIVDPERMFRVYRRIRHHALDADRQRLEAELRADLSRTQLAAVQKKLRASLTASASALQFGSIGGFTSATAKKLQEIWLTPAEEQLEKVAVGPAAPLVSGDTHEPTKIVDLSVPLELPAYLDPALVAKAGSSEDDLSAPTARMVTLTVAEWKAVRDFAGSRLDKKTSGVFTSKADSYNYLAMALGILDAQAKAHKTTDLELVQTSIADHACKNLSADQNRAGHDARCLIAADVWTIAHAVRAALIDRAMSEELADVFMVSIMCRMIELNLSLDRMLKAPTISSMNWISGELFIRRIRKTLSQAQELAPAGSDLRALSGETLERQNSTLRRRNWWLGGTLVGVSLISIFPVYDYSKQLLGRWGVHFSDAPVNVKPALPDVTPDPDDEPDTPPVKKPAKKREVPDSPPDE